MFDEDIITLARHTIDQLVGKGMMIASAESCTGGLVAAALSCIPGSSAVLHGGYITYANRAKSEMLGVSKSLLKQHGAVSKPVVCAMAEGALEFSGADITIAITGIAGPGGATGDKPVGTVHFACALRGKTNHILRQFGNVGRENIRRESVYAALTHVLACLDQCDP